LDELALVEGLRRRREDAVAAFLDRYRALLQHCISQFESDAAARDDLYQELVAYVFERLDRDSFDGAKGSFGTWLYRVVWCRCVDVKRKWGSGRRAPTVPNSELSQEPPDEHPDPADVASDVEVGELVRRCMDDLAPEDAELLRARFVQGQTLSDIAARRSQTLETVKYRLRRATLALRHRLVACAVNAEVLE